MSTKIIIQLYILMQTTFIYTKQKKMALEFVLHTNL